MEVINLLMAIIDLESSWPLRPWVIIRSGWGWFVLVIHNNDNSDVNSKENHLNLQKIYQNLKCDNGLRSLTK